MLGILSQGVALGSGWDAPSGRRECKFVSEFPGLTCDADSGRGFYGCRVSAVLR